MQFSPKSLSLLALAVAALGARALAGDFQIRDGERVVFLGDSITEQRLYTTYIEAYVLTRHPDWKLSFRNVGWGGDTSWLRQRAHPNEGQLFAADEATQEKMVKDSVGRGLGRDVLPLKPTFVTVKFGMNDHAYQPFREDIFRAYVRSQSEIAEVLGANGARVALLTPQPIEEKKPDPDQDVRNQSLRKFSDGLKEVAAKKSVTFVDQFDPYMEIMMRARKFTPSAFIGGGDAVHPGPAGQTIMAWAVLKGLGASALVSSAALDAGSQKVTATENCDIQNLKVTAGVVSFDRLDKALPLPVDARGEAALTMAPVLADLSVYELRIAGLAQGNYDVSVDGTKVATVSAADLAKGWNGTMTAGPITEQARRVLDLVFKKNNVYFNRWRGVQLHEFPGWAQGPDVEAKRTAELAKLDTEVAQLETQINAARQPQSHRFELKPSAP